MRPQWGLALSLLVSPAAFLVQSKRYGDGSTVYMRFFPPRCPCLPRLSTHHWAGTSGRFRAGTVAPIRPDRTAFLNGYADLGGLVVERLRWNGSGMDGNRPAAEQLRFLISPVFTVSGRWGMSSA